MLTSTDALTQPKTEHDLVARVCAEFTEVPGLKLTLWQASRLFGLEVARCEQLFRLLVQDGVLRRQGDCFAHCSTGRSIV
jgi:hypothetical protein